MNRKVKELGLHRLPKSSLKALKNALNPEPIEIQPTDSVRTSAAVRTVQVALPPVDLLHLELPKDFENSQGKMVHFQLKEMKATILGTVDLNKRTQVAHIQYSSFPIAYAFIRPEHQALVESVLRPLQMALWANGVLRQHCEFYIAHEHSSRPLMQQLGLLQPHSQRPKAPLPLFVIHTPDGASRNSAGTTLVMEQAFSEEAV